MNAPPTEGIIESLQYRKNCSRFTGYTLAKRRSLRVGAPFGSIGAQATVEGR